MAPGQARGEAIGEDAILVIAEAPELKGSRRAVETWHQVAGPQSQKRTQEKLLVKVQPSCSSRIPGFWRCQYHGMTTKAISRCGGASRGDRL